MLLLGIPTLNRFDLLDRCIDSALDGTVAPDQVLVIDNSGGQCPRRDEPGIIYALPPRNMGVAWSWNHCAERALAASALLILSNDDVLFAPDTIARLLVVAENDDRRAIVSAIEGERYSLFWLNLHAFEDVGRFDEQFYPAYLEDNDWDYRARLRGWSRPVAPSAVQHERSSTIARFDADRLRAHHQQHAANEARYRRKWGGMPGRERYTVAYGGRL